MNSAAYRRASAVYWSAWVLALCCTVPAWAAEVRGTVTRPDGRPASRVLVWFDRVPGEYRPPSAPAVVRLHAYQFDPAVLGVLKGTEVQFRNADLARHAVSGRLGSTAFDLRVMESGDVVSVIADRTGWTELGCRIYGRMHAWMLVLDHPYVVQTDGQGGFRFPDVPTGAYQLFAGTGPDAAHRERLRVNGEPVTLAIRLASPSNPTVE